MSMNVEGEPVLPCLIATNLTVFKSRISWIQFQLTLFAIGLFNRLRDIYFTGLLWIAKTKLVSAPARPEKIVFGKKQKILDSVSLSLSAGEVIAIMGSNGAGKSTLLKFLSGQMPMFAQGSVLIRNLDPRIAERPGRMVGYLHQDDILHTELSLKDALIYSAQIRHPEISSVDLKKYVIEVMDNTQICHRSGHNIDTLSGGERRRANLSVELLSGASFLFLDEPTSNLDPYHSRKLLHLIKENIVGSDRAVVLSTHDVWNCDLYNKIAFIFEGKLIFYGETGEALEFFNRSSEELNRKVRDLADIYELFESIKNDQERFELVCYYESEWKKRELPSITRPQRPKTEPDRKSIWRLWRTPMRAKIRQWIALSKRFAVCYLTDMLLLLALQPVIASGVIALFVKPEYRVQETSNFGNLQIACFLLIMITSMMGIINSHREIVRERVIHAQEQRAGVGVGAYFFSKIGVLYLISLIQAVMITLVMNYQLGTLPGLVFRSMGIEIFICAFLCMVVNTNLGLLISLLSKTTGQATNMLVPIFALELVNLMSVAFQESKDIPGLNLVNQFMPAGWAYQAIGISLNLNSLTEWNINPILEYSAKNLWQAWICLILLSSSYGLMAILILWLQKKSVEPKHIFLEMNKINPLPNFGGSKETPESQYSAK